MTAANFLPIPTVSTTLSGGGQSGTSISVPSGTAVTDTATLTGTSADLTGTSSALPTGTITYNIYSDPTCTSLVLTGTALTITAGAVPPSPAATLTTPGTYYWQASYSGDSNNSPANSTCGTTGEVQTVTQLVPEPTRIKTALVGKGHRGRGSPGGNSWSHGVITVFAGTALTDTATLTGTNATVATGTVDYSIYRVVRHHRHLVLQSAPRRHGYRERGQGAGFQSREAGARYVRMAGVLLRRQGRRRLQEPAWFRDGDRAPPAALPEERSLRLGW